MGIQGLLPLLKPIQRHRPLSDFSGQTLAVDAYVWLHRGAYGCATELVSGTPTRRYVDFCMQRVRLLRHHGIKPYLVFDGGPLPAKLGTEKERERKRAENVQRAQELTGQGRHSEARELYVKCVDITPEMAYQVIKALKVENVPYVVAPYEADAQLAYLEKIGFVDGIITEDSDLLVFGCKNVLFKLDTVAASVCFISRSDFGSPSLASDSLSLIGWSDAQFRWMAMLSGCDYLPSVPGIGLKTAWSLLKKYKSVDRTIRAIRMEGKKEVPKGYIEAFNLAEKVFLHQRVYDPVQQKLVYLSEPAYDVLLDIKAESYIGRDLEPAVAKKVAEGDLCPISLKDMKDVNPTFKPRPTHPLQDQDVNINEAKMRNTTKIKAPSTSGLRNFFSPLPKTEMSSLPPSSNKPIVAGNASGKRTLVEVMESDMATKKKRKKLGTERQRRRQSAPEATRSSSRFFANLECGAVAGPSRLTAALNFDLEKENAPRTSPENLSEYDVDEEVEEVEEELVAQEDGYISPSPSLARDMTPDISSPVRHRDEVNNDRVDYTFKSIEVATNETRRMDVAGRTQDVEELTQAVQEQEAYILVRGSSEIRSPSPAGRIPGPDLRLNFDDDSDDEKSSEIGTWDDGEPASRFTKDRINPRMGVASPALPPSLSATPPEQTQVKNTNSHTCISGHGSGEVVVDVDEIPDSDTEEALRLIAQSESRERIAQAWKARFSFGGSAYASTSSNSKQQQKTPQVGRPSKEKSATNASSAPPAIRRRSAPFSQSQPQQPVSAFKPRTKLVPRRTDPYPRPMTVERISSRKDPISVCLNSDDDDVIEEVVAGDAKGKLAAFRYAR